MAHLSNPQTQRTLRFVTLAASAGAGITSIFFSKFEEVEGFEGKEHIYTHIQKDARDFVDRVVFGIDPDLVRKSKAAQEQNFLAPKPNLPEPSKDAGD